MIAISTINAFTVIVKPPFPIRQCCRSLGQWRYDKEHPLNGTPIAFAILDTEIQYMQTIGQAISRQGDVYALCTTDNCGMIAVVTA
jgi:hypothetical protein